MDKITGNFWSEKQRQANRIQEISYRACFKPLLPRYFINEYSNIGDVIYDPFMGRGTTAIESALMSRIPYGNDILHLSKALVEPRINPPVLQQIKKRLDSINWKNFKDYKNENLLVFYHPKTLAHLEGLRNYLKTNNDKIDRWIRMVAINRLSGHSKGFFSVKTMPPSFAVSIESQKKINKKYNQTPEFKNISDLIYKKSTVLLSGVHPTSDKHLFLVGESSNTPQIKNAEVDIIITSPPFLNIVDYNKDNWLRNWFLNEKQQDIKLYNKLEDWKDFTYRTLKELHRVLKPNKYIFYEVGEINKGKNNLEHAVIDSIRDIPLVVENILINKHNFKKLSNCFGVDNNEKGTNTNRIVILKKIK